ncbi:MAG: alpha/beta fold hydrolase [Myxococcota bacterium]
MYRHINGHQAWVQHDGDTGPPILFIMGFGISGDGWQLQVEGLSPDHRVAWYDVRGLGRSKPGDGRLHLATLAEDAVGILDALGWEAAHVVGISMGGMIAQTVALDHPDRVLSLTLITTHAGGGLRATLPTLRGLSAFTASNLSRGLGRHLALGLLLFPLRHWATLPLNTTQLRSLGGRAPAWVRMRHLQAIRSFDARRRLSELADLPVLLVRAGADILIPPHHTDKLLAYLPHAHLLDLPSHGHGSIITAHDAINQAIRTFIQDTSRPQA